MRARVCIAALACAITLSGASDASAQPPIDPVAVANQAWPGAPCAGRLSVIFDPAVGERGHGAEATGVIPWPDRPWELTSCDITVDPVIWAVSDTEMRCLTLVHEAGHLAGLDHTPGTVMSPPPTRGSWPACLTDLQRAGRFVQAATGSRVVTCSPARGRGRVFSCVAHVGHRRLFYRARVAAGVSGRLMLTDRV